MAEIAGKVGRDAFERAATGAPEGRARGRPGRGDRAPVRGPRGPATRRGAGGRAREPRGDPLVLRAGVQAGGAVGAAAEEPPPRGGFVFGRPDAHLLRLT